MRSIAYPTPKNYKSSRLTLVLLKMQLRAMNADTFYKIILTGVIVRVREWKYKNFKHRIYPSSFSYTVRSYTIQRSVVKETKAYRACG